MVDGRESRIYTAGRFSQLGFKVPGRPRRSPSVAEIAENRQGQERRYTRLCAVADSGVPGNVNHYRVFVTLRSARGWSTS